jgi:hypothetical protein
MELVTIKDYCSQKDVSRQFVYEYIKKGKFEVVELPIFVRFEGIEIEVGKQKFLKDPLTNQDRKWYWSGEISNEDYANGMANDASKNETVRTILRDMLMLTGAAKKNYRDEMLERYKDSPLKLEIEAGMKKCFELMKLEVADLDSKVKAFESKVKAN